MKRTIALAVLGLALLAPVGLASAGSHRCGDAARDVVNVRARGVSCPAALDIARARNRFRKDECERIQDLCVVRNVFACRGRRSKRHTAVSGFFSLRCTSRGRVVAFDVAYALSE